MAGYWSIILPLATTNLVTNPSFELGVTGWTKTDGGTSTSTFARSTTYSFRGSASAKIVFTYGNSYSFYATADIPVTVGVSYTASVDFYVPGSIGAGTYTLKINWFDAGGGYLSSSSSTNYVTTGYWWRASSTGAAPASAVTGRVTIVCDTATFTIYIDGAQFEAQSAASTYCDGDQKDCKWAAAKHRSTSTRSARTRAGGQIVNLDSLGLYIEEISGIGMPDIAHRTRTQPQKDGGTLLGHTVLPRAFELAGIVPGTSRANLHTLRKALINAIKADAVLDDTQPCILRYAGSNSTKEAEIYANYDTGFTFSGIEGYTERMGVRWIAYDPYFYEAGEVSATLTTSSAITDANYIIAKIDGAWQALGTGMDAEVHSIAFAPDGSVYAAGAFTTSGGVLTNRLGKWDGAAWSMVGTTTGFDNRVLKIAVDAGGNIYAGGFFHAVDGTTVNHGAYWNGSAWSMWGVTTGFNDVVFDIAINNDGDVYVGGAFTSVDGVANTSMIAKWDGSVFTPLGTGLVGSSGACLEINPNNGNVYVGGSFSSANSVTADNIAMWNGTTFEALGAGLPGNSVKCLELTPYGDLYAGGDLTGNDFWMYNGASWTEITTPIAEVVYIANYDQSSGLLYVGIGKNDLGSLSTWNGTVWAGMDIKLPGATSYIKALGIRDGDIYLGFDTSGTATTSYSGTFTNNGTHEIHPVIKIKRSGGTSATLSWIKNETTGKTLWFNYALLDGEELTLDLRPGSRNITSSYWGNAWRALQRGSDFASFTLLPGANIITTVITEVGSPTVTAYASWRNTHWSADGTAA